MIIYILVFVTFFAIVYYVTTPPGGKTRQCFSDKMTEPERQTLHDLLIIVDGILKKNDIDWIPTGGSLLSIYRNKKLFLKWDDDYDMTVNKPSEALSVLQDSLKDHNCTISFYNKWINGDLYKIYFNDSKIKHKTFNWPFIDLFLDVPYNESNFHPHNILAEEYPLIMENIDGIIINTPSSGSRSYESYLNNGHITTCKEQNYSHKYSMGSSCYGPKTLQCHQLN
jgi:hypothetical protein